MEKKLHRTLLTGTTEQIILLLENMKKVEIIH
jgi:hypothetical protein